LCVLSSRRRNFGFLRFHFLETKASWVQKWGYFGNFGGPEINMDCIDSNFLFIFIMGLWLCCKKKILLHTPYLLLLPKTREVSKIHLVKKILSKITRSDKNYLKSIWLLVTGFLSRHQSFLKSQNLPQNYYWIVPIWIFIPKLYFLKDSVKMLRKITIVNDFYLKISQNLIWNYHNYHS
jgi:hypothetical protein